MSESGHYVLLLAATHCKSVAIVIVVYKLVWFKKSDSCIRLDGVHRPT